MYTLTHAHTWRFISALTHLRARTHAHTHTHACTHTHTHTHTHRNTDTHTQKHRHTHTFIHTHIHICIQVHMHHTHTADTADTHMPINCRSCHLYLFLIRTHDTTCRHTSWLPMIQFIQVFESMLALCWYLCTPNIIAGLYPHSLNHFVNHADLWLPLGCLHKLVQV